MSNRTMRDNMKRQAAHAHHDLDLTIDHLSVLGALFEKEHPEMEEGLVIAAQLCQKAKELIETFVLLAWGKDEVNWDAWRDVPVYKGKKNAA